MVNKMMSHNIKHQSGSILVVSLVLLLVMTLMGVTSMSITTSELKIASNQQAHNNSYEGAFSMIDAVRRSTVIAWDNTDRAAPQNAVADNLDADDSGFSSTAIITYDHCIRGAAGNSLTVEAQDGDSSSNFGRVVQEIFATGNAMKDATVTATTAMVNGISAPVAACP